MRERYKGHRQRFLSRFQKYPWLFGQVDLLEILLFQVIIRKDTRPLAIQILQKYHNIHNALENIQPNVIPGIGIKTCSYLKILNSLLSALNIPYIQQPIVMSLQKIIKQCQIKLYWRSKEQLYIFFLNQDYYLIHHEALTTGTHNSVPLDVRLIIQKALEYNASIIVLCHNHPNGNTKPSAADIKYTYNLQKKFTGMGIYFWDHIIIAANQYFSMRENNLLNNYE